MLTDATGINEHNEIVGSGLYQGQKRAYMLRQEGRITRLDPVIQTNVWVYTNEFDASRHPDHVQVEAQVIQWAGIWGGNAAPRLHRGILRCPASLTTGRPSRPRPNGPSPRTYWTNTDFGAVPMRFFRVRAQ